MAITQDQQFTNNATTTVPATISSGATSITVATGTGALFPSLSGAQFFAATIVNTISADPGFGQFEIVKVTARSGDVLTIVRSQESTAAHSYPAGCLFELRPTAQAFGNIYSKVIAADALKADIASPTFTGDPKAPTPALGDNDTSIATSGYVQTAFNNYGNRFVNMIINPHGSIQQETTTPVTGGSYFSDQWDVTFTAATAAMQTGVTTGTVSSYDISHMFMKTTTAKASLAAGDFLFFEQRVEGNHNRRLLYGTSSAKGSWLRWRASASQSGTASVAIRNGTAANRSFVQSFAVTTTPTDYTLFIPGDTTGTWTTDTSWSASVSFCHSSGTTFQTSTLGAWQAGNFIASNTQSNMLDTVNRQLNITDVQWSDNPILLPFQSIDYSAELLRCQRYFWKITSAPTPNDFYLGGGLVQASTTSIVFSWKLPVTMRVAPSVTSSGTIDIFDGSTVTSLNSLSNNGNTTDHVSGVWALNAALVAGRSVIWILRQTGSGTLFHNARM